MFDSLDMTQEVDKAEFKAEEPLLRGRLIDAQFDLLEAGDFPVVVLLSGMDVLGRSAAAKQLMSWMDPRYIRPYAALRPGEEERDRPRMWRFWGALPRKGRIGIFLNAWYEGPIRDRFLGRSDDKQLQARIDEILRFERLLAAEGALLLKFFFLLPEKQRLKAIRKLKKGDAAAWKLSEEEAEIMKQLAKRRGRAVALLDAVVRATGTAEAPWIPLPSADPRYRDLTLGRTLADAVRARLARPAPPPPKRARRAARAETGPNILDSLDLGKALARDDYRARLKAAQRRVTAATLSRSFEDRALVAVFEGNDAAGKGGSIRRLVQALDPRLTRVIPIAAPSDEEKAQPYLWRFWRHLPPRGHLTVFDRSWYGRVLVERVEGFAAEPDWRRAYDEIRAFEAELAEYGVIVVKFWLAIDKKEQLCRFKEREKVGYKRYKITDEDWRNRKKWSAYAQAVHDMVERTSTSRAPWTLVEANDKYHARVKVLETINERLKESL